MFTPTPLILTRAFSIPFSRPSGYLHTIDHPLLPPPSILTAAYLFPKYFSTLTSAVQKVGGQKYLEWDIDPKASKEEKKRE